MKLKLKIRHKIQFLILFTTIIIYTIAIGFLSINTKKMAYKDAISISDNCVKGAANEVNVYLENYYATLLELRNSFEVYKEINEDNRRNIISQLMINSLRSNSDFLSVWSTWESNSIDNLDKQYVNQVGSSVLGNFCHMYYKDNGEIRIDESITNDAEDIFDGDFYQLPKKTRKTIILEPYYYSYTKNAIEFLETSIATPIIVENKFLGVVGADIQLEQFQEIIKTIKPFENSTASLISNGGKYIAAPDPSYLGKSIMDMFPTLDKEFEISDHIKNGEFLSYSAKRADGSMYYSAYAPIKIGETDTPWAIEVTVPIDQVMAEANRNFKISIFVGIIGLLILSIVLYFISNNITKPILKITEFLKSLAKGHINTEMYEDNNTGDEIDEMRMVLNESIAGLIEKTKFAQDIGNGNLESELRLLSDQDIIGQSLIDMRDKLKKNQKEEVIRKAEDDKRKWATEGLALFGDVLRQNNDKLKDLSINIIRNLVRYLNAIQAGLFIKNNDNETDVFFELQATFAYNREKYKQKEIRPGEGLIGTCGIEGKTIYLTDLPDNYIEIKSGLGNSSPKSILIVPLKKENEVLGIVELASFNLFKDYEIEFVEKIGESIASTIASVRINEHTSRILENTQLQAEQMAAQEEEMRQNLEELQATQEEAARKSLEMENLITALNKSTYIAEYDLSGKIIEINDAYANLFNIRREEAVGIHHSNNIVFTDEQEKKYEQFWNDLKNGIVRNEKTQITINNQNFLFKESYNPVFNENEEVYKIMKIANDISEYMAN